jgi:hypothetical protein
MSHGATPEPSCSVADATGDAPARLAIRLRCLAGGVVSDELRDDVDRCGRIPAAACDELEALLAPCVLQPMARELGERLSRFCLRYELAEAEVGRLVKVCRWLLREASAMDLSVEELEHDLALLWPEPSALRGAVHRAYEPIKALLREQLVADALVKHGNVLTDVDWRLDAMVSERQAARLAVPVALVTLAYRDAERAHRLTLQISPAELERLAQIFGALAQKVRLSTR